MYLLDADYLIDLLKGKEEAHKFFQSIRGDVYTSVICVAEVLEGIYNYRDSKSLRIFEEFIHELKVLDVDMDVAMNYALLRGNLRKKGNLLDKFDLMIASTCLAHKLVLVTRNLKHFQRIPKLKVYKHKN